jgi:hypothetical protein
MGFKITRTGVEYVLEWGEAHPSFVQKGHTLLDAMGKTMGSLAPQWVAPELRNEVHRIEEWW